MADGRVVAYKRRRFLPQGDDAALLARGRTVAADDRLDLIDRPRRSATREHFWRICDANDAMDPVELTEQPGRALRIPVPQP